MRCRCDDVLELWGDEAKTYVSQHLREVDVRADGWGAIHVCPVTGIRWVEDYPHGEEHGGGLMRLRQLTRLLKEGP